MRHPHILALMLAAAPIQAQAQAPTQTTAQAPIQSPVTATPLAPPGMSPPPGPLTRPPAAPRDPQPALVPLAPPPASPSALPPGPAVPLGAAPPDAVQRDAAPSAGARIPNRLPDPAVPEGSPPSAFIAAARNAISAGRIGEATEAIERAETRILVRSVRPSLAREPSEQALVRKLAEARAALAAGDRTMALEKLTDALRDPWIDAPPQE